MRDNNGVRAKVYHDVGRGSENRTGGDKAKEQGDESTKKAGTMADMASHHGPKGSSGTEKDMGGVGNNMGSERRDFFKDEH